MPVLILTGLYKCDSGAPIWRKLENKDGDPEYELVAVYSGEFPYRKWYEPATTFEAGIGNTITRNVLEWINKLRTMSP